MDKRKSNLLIHAIVCFFAGVAGKNIYDEYIKGTKLQLDFNKKVNEVGEKISEAFTKVEESKEDETDDECSK